MKCHRDLSKKRKIKTPEKEQNEMEIVNLLDAEFKTLVIRMLRELTEYGKSIREEMKAMLSGIKKSPQGTNSEGKEARIQINNLEHKDKINSQPEQNKQTRIQKNKERIRRLWNISKSANIRITGMPEGEEEEQQIENVLEKIMKENLLNLMNEIDIQVQEAQRVPNKLAPKRSTPKHFIIRMPKVRDEERILRASRERQRVTYKGVPIRMSVDFLKHTLQARRDWQKVLKVMKSKDLQPRLFSKAVI